jgi:citrate lyase subunit beta / citryl-CoA lyase
MQPRRSLLFMPGHNVRAIQKAQTLPTDVVIIDLEDAVAPETKPEARTTAQAEITTGDFGAREVAVRINSPDTDWHTDDLAAFSATSIAAIVVPKVETHSQVRDIGVAMDRLGYPASVGLWLMAETPAGILNARGYCRAHPRVQALLVGTSDLAKCLRTPATESRIGLLHALSQAVLVAREAGIDVFDGVSLKLNDPEGFEAECIQGRDLGFDGKTLIHPSQIATANQVFAPSEASVTHASEIVAAWTGARARGEGVCVLDGRLVENLHVDEANRTLAMAKAIAER